ncbi:MAG: HAMP domain-containing protein [Bryobacteraceae bacterium]
MRTLRARLILIFLAATLAPLGATLWITTSLLEQSVNYTSIRELDEISKTLEKTGRSYYQRAREDLKQETQAGRVAPVRHSRADLAEAGPEVREFWESGQPERFQLSGRDGDRLEYLVRDAGGVLVYSTGLGGIGMDRISEQFRQARALIEANRARDLRRGFTYTYVLLAASIWLSSLLLLVFLAHRISRPIRQLTAGLGDVASGNLSARVQSSRDDEVGLAIRAFNRMADRLESSTERLVYLRQIASWQTLARKMAHEVKNSLTPIRLTVEEMLARHSGSDRVFLEQAAQIVVDEVETLERRVRAFSEFSAEPDVLLAGVDVNGLVEERVAFLKAGHPDVLYELRLDPAEPQAWADEDLIKGVLTNLLENAAQAAEARPPGRILALTALHDGRAAVEVHDSGPGLNPEARRSLFQPTISFKKHGMGLGLSIARRSALLSRGDLLLIDGALGGAAFRLLLSTAATDTDAACK